MRRISQAYLNIVTSSSQSDRCTESSYACAHDAHLEGFCRRHGMHTSRIDVQLECMREV